MSSRPTVQFPAKAEEDSGRGAKGVVLGPSVRLNDMAETRYINAPDYVPQKGDVFQVLGINYTCKGVSKDQTKLRIVGQPWTSYANTGCSRLVRAAGAEDWADKLTGRVG